MQNPGFIVLYWYLVFYTFDWSKFSYFVNIITYNNLNFIVVY
jgi:hypothetical protein